MSYDNPSFLGRMLFIVLLSLVLAFCGGGVGHVEDGESGGSDEPGAVDVPADEDVPEPVPDGEPDPGDDEPDPGPCQQMPLGVISLPADDTVHHGEDMEWWYWTGHLVTDGGRWFGFEEVFFRKSLLGQQGRMVHAAVTDIDQGTFPHAVSIQLGDLPAVPDGFDFSMSGQTARGGGGDDVLHAEAESYVLDLELHAVKPPVFQHGDGYTDYSFGGYTYYYSRERMAAAGTLAVDGTSMTVNGSAWFDHQWGAITMALTMGWDWFALQLDDDREIMLFVVHGSGGEQLLVGGSYTDEACATAEISPDAFAVAPLGQWVSPHTSCTYPSGWTVAAGDLTFTVTPVIQDQELPQSVPIYWEGAALVSGSAGGRAYVELTGYCPAL
jgi:predicted secreted hydrolase